MRALLVAAALALLLPAESAMAAHHKPKPFNWGSSLKPAATQSIPGPFQGTFAADAEFWNTSLGSSAAGGVTRALGAPRSGRILSVKLKTGNDSQSVPLRFSVVQPLGGGRFKVLTTSTPKLTLPAHSPGVHTFNLQKPNVQFNMPINKGDYLAVATQGVKPGASIWYASASGASADFYSSHGATQNPGYVWNGTARPGLELLLQVRERPGPSYHFHLP